MSAVPALAPAPGTTTTTGYFNYNKFPIAIRSQSLGVNLTIPPPDPTTGPVPIVDRQGRRVNDPRLDSFCGAGGLTKQLGDPVPLVRLSAESPGVGLSAQPPTKQPAPVKPNQSANRQVQRLPVHATITDRPIPPQPHAPAKTGSTGFTGQGPRPGVTPPGINPAVRAMTVAEAERTGVIGRAHRPTEGLKVEDGVGALTAGKEAPYADETRPPRNAAPPPVRRGPQVHVTTTVGAEVPDAEVMALPLPEADELPPADEFPAEPPRVPLRLPPPNLDETHDEQAPAKVYEYAADGKNFGHYSSLARHVRKHFKEREAELLGPYRRHANDAPGE
jgi:hypothetical protein